MTNTFEQFDVETAIETAVEKDIINSLVIYNDDINTFEHVIETLIEVCDHSPDQAEQCTLLIHHKGKCAVKKGSFTELIPFRNGVCERGISAEII
ncbi:MAG: ATP-dependent Clp protease adaptor ClpS [Pseudarcicella sp.]|nr:ATP-dependent Clp protease adaptor ClpS [Pseudarcicella sp.]MBP6410678.1 ATP-dependent Clp protease adaptor ClpS [Pseudarcicella sp.]